MLTTINCEKCEGTGTECILACDECGSIDFVGKYTDKDLCQKCFYKTLTDEDIKNL